ncbi:Type I restriction modification system endonuclease (R) subunit, HsdR [Mycoplasma yeatsii 13926]|uniref:type I site-specific deoxyribonuclease n=1 Tax=Mycoplasma yeatsii 13926 TaxID=1188240 RepID=S6G3E6_9MOLU|nr:DEAD/DEAH box helicase family protein [Mycoplasma yeatsii]EOA07066.1 Type I restriction modification system endonuclease (R) subunit, HsdR [Mycoplasma yeatsii 13926]
MSYKEFNEKTRVQIPAMVHLLRLGYKYFGKIKSEDAGINYDKDTNILIDIFKSSLRKFNPNLNEKQISDTIEEIKDKLRNNDLGKSFYFDCLLSTSKKIIDFEHTENNVFHFTAEFSCENGDDSFRPDITLFINGLPLVNIEVKIPNNSETINAEHERMLYRIQNKKFKKFLQLTQLYIFSNNMEYSSENGIKPTQGAFYGTVSENNIFFNSFREDKINGDELGFYKNFDYDIVDEKQEEKILHDLKSSDIKNTPEYKTNIDILTPTNRIITSLCSKERLLVILKYGIAFLNQVKEEDKQTVTIKEKHIIRYPQLLAILALKNKLDQGIKKGVIWHVQGSGKTALSYFLTKYITDYYSKKCIITKFYFIVDRLDLLQQASLEFEKRGLTVNKINNKHQFKEHFKKYSAVENHQGKAEINVVNIQRFDREEDDDKVIPYDINTQRIFIVDEAHRSYDPKGSFLEKLLTVDQDAIKIGLTGTPLLKEEKQTWKIFGDYIHSYYYDKSIKDGYTLKIFRSDIETSYKHKMSKVYSSIKVSSKSVNSKIILAHPNYVKELTRYIISDFKKFYDIDKTLGGMVVCHSAEQAREIYKQFNDIQNELNQNTFDNKSDLKVGLILSNYEDKEFRNDIINDFKYNNKINILIVYNMLLTGFDAPRLKRLYLAREMKDHSLLQAITRVNRPYKEYQYGYIIDFADIKNSFEKTNEKYLQELKKLDFDGESFEFKTDFYNDILENSNELIDEVIQIQNKLIFYPKDNLEEFRKQIEQKEKEVLIDLKKSLERLQEISNISILSNHKEIKESLTFKDSYKSKEMLKEVDKRIKHINASEKLKREPVDAIKIDEILSDFDFQFNFKTQEELDIISQKEVNLTTVVTSLRSSLKNYKYKDSDQYIDIETQIKKRLKKANITPISSIQEYNEEVEFYKEKENEIKQLKEQDKVIEQLYDNDVKFVKLHKILRSKRSLRIDRNPNNSIDIDDVSTIDMLNNVREKMGQVIDNRRNFLSNRTVVQGKIFKIIKQNTRIPNITSDQIRYISGIITDEYIQEFNH